MEKIKTKRSSTDNCKVQNVVGEGAISGPSLKNDTAKIAVKTKNGLVNGVSEEKCKSVTKSSKKDTKNNKQIVSDKHDTKTNKRRNNPNVQKHDKPTSVLYKSPKDSKSKTDSHMNNDTPTRSIENCNDLSHLETNENVIVNSKECSKDTVHKSEYVMDKPESKINQSETQSSNSDPQSSKSETKRGKCKAKTNKIISDNVHPCLKAEYDFTLPSPFQKMLPSSSEAGCSKYCMDSTPDNSPFNISKDDEFEKDLIKSIASLKVSNEAIKEESRKLEELSELELDKIENIVEEPKIDYPPIEYVQYESELQMPMIMKIIQKDLSEPYSIYTYRYFIHNWPKLCFLAMCENKCVGAIVCKLDLHRTVTKRGYIAMLAVDENYRKRSIGSTLVCRAIKEMISGGADEVVLETEVTNKPALRLYEQLGFVRDKRLFRYYLNGVDALRLKLWLR